MQRQTVESSVIRSVGYDPATEALEIEFHHGEIYVYAKVPPSVFEALITAPSKGLFFHDSIKDHFVFSRDS